MMNRQQRFSLRKYKFGVASVLLGTVLVFGTAQASADEQKIQLDKSNPQVVAVAKQAQTSNLIVAQDLKQATASPTEMQSKSVKDEKNSTSEVAAKSDTDKDQIIVPEVTAAAKQDSDKETKEIALTNKTSEKATAEKASDKKSDANNDIVEHREEAAKPQSIASDEIITVPQTWKQGYKGEGMVVAIIDSGLDVNHEVLRISDVSKAKFKNPEAIEAAKKAAGIDYGKWYNDKVVFAYDYFDGTDNIKEGERESHGMHVTGIATGNPDKVAANGEKIYGVAPEAQVMFMRVFSDRQRTTGSALYVKAIDDAVALGADAINMSLGSSTGSTVDAGSDIVDAIKRARSKGVSVLISAGNSNTFGNGHSKPLAENPDYGVVGNPSTVEDSISVASINNKVVTSKVFVVKGLEKNDQLDHGKFDYNQPGADADFEKGKEYDYVAVGLGKEEDFKGVDVTGKLALIQRGAIPFSEKIANALHHGAVGAMIYNNVDGSNINMSIDGDAKKIPSVFIAKRYGEALKTGSYKIVFNDTMDNRPSPVADQLSDFSSWGVTTDGQLKPDVTAPGGNIFSSLNDNTYGNMSGTSMAAPHVTGVAALVKEYLVKKHPELTPEQVSETVKALIMSTAKLHINKETGVYTSPRQQGAGVVDTAAAVSTDLYVTGENNYPSVSLGNVGDNFTFNVTLHNISDTDRTLKMLVNTDTDEVKDGKFTLRPRRLTETAWPEVTVKAHGSETVTVKVDTRKFTEELTKEMPNGYFLEGFVRFVDPADDGDVVSLPFMGFKGEFQNLPAVEKPIYNLIREDKNGFYYNVPKDLDIPKSADASAVLTLQNDLLVSSGKREGNRVTVLGIEENADGKRVLQLDEKGNLRIAISPNADRNKDFVEYKTVVLRNLVNLHASVYSASDTEHKNPIWEGSTTDLRKNFFDSNPKNPRSYILNNTAWNGTDTNGNIVADGLYDYVIQYTPNVPGADEQSTTFKIQVDTKKPVITSGYIRFENGKQQFIARKPEDVGNGGILSEKVFYLTPFDDKGTMVQNVSNENGTRATENYHYIKVNQDGSYTLPENISKSDIYYEVEDFAGNVDYVSLAELVRDQNSGRVQVAVRDAKTNKDLDTMYVYRIKDSNGKYVNLDKSKSVNFLNFGHYTAEIFTYDRTEVKFVSKLSQEFDLTESNSFQTITFLANVLEYAPLSVSFDQPVSKVASVILKGADGINFVLPSEKYGKNGFGKTVETGTYHLVVTLPTGYELLDADPVVTVVAGKNNVYHLSVVSKLALLESVNKDTNLIETAQYYNANREKRTAFDLALQAAKIALTSKLSQEEINKAVARLEVASRALDGKASNINALKEAMKVYEATTKTKRYINSKEKARYNYDRAFQTVALLVIDPKVHQEQIDQVLEVLTHAESKLNGKATDFSVLRKHLNEEVKFQHKSERFIYAKANVKKAYLVAFKAAQVILNRQEASQEDVNEAIETLNNAKQKLDGKKPRARARRHFTNFWFTF